MKKLIIAVLTGLVFSACTKEDNLTSEPTFDVTVDKTTYKAGDTVRFKFSGDADYLTMYTGEVGSKYEYKDRTRADGKVTCNIVATLRNTLGAKSLWVYAITDLNPLRDSASVVNANWIDISSRYNIPTVVTTGANFGTADLSDIVQPNKPVYFAFKYLTKNSTTTVADRWTITQVNVKNELPDGTINTVATVGGMGWKAINISNSQAYNWDVSGTTVYTTAAAPKNTGDTENWAVSAPIYVDAMVRDYPKTIKDIIAVLPKTYEYIYQTKGTYKIYFVALNSRNGNTSKITKQIEITVQ